MYNPGKFDGESVVLTEPGAQEIEPGSKLAGSAFRRPQVDRFRGSAEEMRQHVLDNPVEVDQYGGFDVPEEKLEIEDELDDIGSLDSTESIDRLYAYVANQIKARAEEYDLDEVDFKSTQAATALEDFADLLEAIKVLVIQGELTNEDGEIVQAAYDRAIKADLSVEETAAVEKFDPNQYIAEQFTEHQYLIPSQRMPVYLLQREYKRALAEGATGDSETLAQQIKEYVDELVGNDSFVAEGVSANLESRERRRGDLALQDLDAEELDQGPPILTEADRVYPPENEADTESIPTELYGMRLPTAEDLYRFNATTFRDGLELAMRHDSELAQLPEKQQLFAELLNLLEFVPTDGISTETAEQLRELAQKINDPNVAMQRMEVAQEVPVEPTEQSDRSVVSPSTEYVSPSELERLINLHGEEVGRDMYEAKQVQANLQAEIEQQKPQQPTPESDTQARAAASPFTPVAIQEQQPTVREVAREAREYDNKVKELVSDIEKTRSGGSFLNFFNPKSPYEQLGDADFETLVLNSQTEFVTGAQRGKFMNGLKQDGIDQAAFNEWMKLLPEIQDLGIETNGKTFKEVADALIKARIEERNTQSV